MKRSTFALATIVAALIFAPLPALAGRDRPPRPVAAAAARPAPASRAAQARTYSRPQRAYAAAQTYSRPRRAYAPPHTWQRIAAPARVWQRNAAPARVWQRNAAPARVWQRNVQFVRQQHIGQRAPFAQYVRVSPNRRAARAPFVEYMRVGSHRSSFAPRLHERANLAPIAAYALRRNREERAPSYHPAYLSGRLVGDSAGEVVLQGPSGQDIPVRWRDNADYMRWHRRRERDRSSYVTIPAQYYDGAYYADAYAPPNPASYDYRNDSAYALNAPYGNSAYAPALYGTYAPYDYSSYSPAYSYGSGYNASYGDNDGDEYPDSWYAPNGYPYGIDPNGCTWYDPDNDGDGSSLGASCNQNGSYYAPGGYGAVPADYYGAPAPYANQYAPAQVQGLVVATMGSTAILVGPNGLTPIVVDASQALQNGSVMNGPLTAGRIVSAYGYYGSSNTFVATALE